MGCHFCILLSHYPQWKLHQTHQGCGGVVHGISAAGFRWHGMPRQEMSIAAMELVPIVLACAIWGQSWQACQVCCRCDNQVVVAALRTRSNRDEKVMHLLRYLIFVEAQLDCHLSGEYIDTCSNHLADNLSHDNAVSFLSKVPSADRLPTPMSAQLLSLLLNPQADWISLQWRHQFSAIFSTVLPPPHRNLWSSNETLPGIFQALQCLHSLSSN